MFFICKCAVCEAVTEGDLEGSQSRLEFDFIDQIIRFVCPKCKKENEMSLLTSNKLRDRALPGMRLMRG